MLNKKEISVMRTVYNACKNNNDSAIISDAFIIESTPEKYRFTEEKIDLMLNQLQYDGYFECTKSQKNNQTVNVITLKSKGKAFERELVQRKRELTGNAIWRMIFAALGAVVALAVNKLLP